MRSYRRKASLLESERVGRTTEETAARYGISEATLRKFRETRDPHGPPYHRIGVRVLYSWSETDAWFAKTRVKNVAGQDGAA